MWTPQLMIKLDHTFGDDGIFWISYKDFLKEFPHINRVRLFNKDWKVAQQWTCVNVPWTVDYLDTKFEITVTERGPLVVVLSQPDTRYFYGLAGRYLYSLHFRVYKEGSDTYLFRSMHNSGNGAVHTRSVSAELDDVEPGTYSVIFKVTAVLTVAATSAEAIEKYAVDRKEKLLDVGRKFDYAQSKGNLRTFERTHERERRIDGREQSKDFAKKTRETNMKNRARDKLRKKRIVDALNEKRKVAQEKEREKRKRRKARVEQKREQARQLAKEQQDDNHVPVIANESGSDKDDVTPTSEVGTSVQVETSNPSQASLTAEIQDTRTQEDNPPPSNSQKEPNPTTNPTPTTHSIPEPLVRSNTPTPHRSPNPRPRLNLNRRKHHHHQTPPPTTQPLRAHLKLRLRLRTGLSSLTNLLPARR
jgi:hypothetical protein